MAVQGRVSAYEGTCCLRTGRVDNAVPVLAEALDGIPAGMEGQRSFLLADLATAYIRQCQPEQDSQALRQVIGIIGRTGAAIPTQRVHRARRELQSAVALRLSATLAAQPGATTDGGGRSVRSSTSPLVVRTKRLR